MKKFTDEELDKIRTRHDDLYNQIRSEYRRDMLRSSLIGGSLAGGLGYIANKVVGNDKTLLPVVGGSILSGIAGGSYLSMRKKEKELDRTESKVDDILLRVSKDGREREGTIETLREKKRGPYSTRYYRRMKY